MNSAETTARSGWFCLRTQPRREHTAAQNLRQRVGVDVFAPRILVRHRTRGGLMALAEALFPGYVFARFNYAEQVRHVVSTQGITGVVRFGGCAPAVADGVIEFLRAQVSLASQAGPAPVFEAGAWVRIVSGCFRDIEGRVLSFDSKTERVRLLLSLLGQEIQVSVPVRELAEAGESRPRLPEGLLADEAHSAPLA
ncbi:MAG TPA: transcription termination/antitermination NusG family protein [Opitutus sp.]|nr:transcription termination/antitermination NusG family protein [Opitutus sp.]